jgi:hypothetical protein
VPEVKGRDNDHEAMETRTQKAIMDKWMMGVAVLLCSERGSDALLTPKFYGTTPS